MVFVTMPLSLRKYTLLLLLLLKTADYFFGLRSMTLLTPDTLDDKNSSKSEKQTHILFGP